MASGSSHDCATWWLGLAFGLLCWPVVGWIGSCTGGLAFLIGGLLLSPDLDTISRPTRRWGPLQLLWWPYRSLLKHRSLFSHSPVLGTGGRLAYLAGLALAGAWLLAPWGAPTPGVLLQWGQQVWSQHQALVLLTLAGLEAREKLMTKFFTKFFSALSSILSRRSRRQAKRGSPRRRGPPG